jgi:hypothetical protein
VPSDQRPVPDWSAVHRDLRRPNVTLALLWEEYRTATTDGFGYSWFCDLYREWAGRLKPTLRQVHIAGERLFVDFAGHTMEVIDAATGEIHRAEIFVAVLGASSFIYAEATASQALDDWIGAHVNALNAIGGVPRRIVSDNLKAGITKACFYEPTVNRTYAPLRRFHLPTAGSAAAVSAFSAPVANASPAALTSDCVCARATAARATASPASAVAASVNVPTPCVYESLAAENAVVAAFSKARAASYCCRPVSS